MGNYGQGPQPSNPITTGMQPKPRPGTVGGGPPPPPGTPQVVQPQRPQPVVPNRPLPQLFPNSPPPVAPPPPGGGKAWGGQPAPTVQTQQQQKAPAQQQGVQPQPPAPPPANAAGGAPPAQTQPAGQQPGVATPQPWYQGMASNPRKEYQTKEGTKYRTMDYNQQGGAPGAGPAGWGMQMFNPQTNQWENVAQTQFGNGNFSNFGQFHQAVGNADFSTDAGVQAWINRMNALSGPREGQRQLYTTGEGNQYRTYNMPGQGGGWGMETWDPTTGAWKNVAQQAFGQGNPYSNFEQFHAAMGNADFSTNNAVQQWLAKLQAAQAVMPPEPDTNSVIRNRDMASAMFSNNPRLAIR